MRSLLLSVYLAVPLLFGACGKAPKPAPPPPQPIVADVKPLGDGLEVIGFAIIGAAVVITLGRLLR
jgi:hypothetical protein